MKKIKEYITERLKISSDIKIDYNYFPQTKEELQKIIIKLLDERGPNADLNDIDVSQVNDMSGLFNQTVIKQDIHNIDISRWDVSQCKNMSWMFSNQDNFNSDLSQWDVSRCENMTGMFEDCRRFNSDISDWDVSNVKTINRMFFFCEQLNVNLDNWQINPNCKMHSAFYGCSIKKQPKWYIKNKLKASKRWF